jgi:hypothetical protein
MREPIDSELEAVSGGLFDFGNIVIQPSIGLQVGVALGGGITFGNAGSAAVQQVLSQGNVSAIA